MDTKKSFQGFPSDKTRLTRLPAVFFSELLPEIDHLGELKLVLYVFWRLERMEGAFRYLQRTDFLEDKRFMLGLGGDQQQAAHLLDESLQQAVERGILLTANINEEGVSKTLYFLNSPKGRTAIQAIQKGEWSPFRPLEMPIELERPNIFQLYEENIGPLTPLIADALREAEKNYPLLWIEEALQIAVLNNARNWNYIEAILRRWQERGRDDKKDQGDTERGRRGYFEDTDFVEH
jgi:DNA replication protein